MDNQVILIIGLIMYLLGTLLSFITKNKTIQIGLIVLWFIPIFMNINIFITIFSIIMIFTHIILAFFSEKEEDY